MKYREKDWLEEQYHGRGLSIYQIADEIGCHHDTIHRWMKRHGIQARPFCGRKQPNHHASFKTDHYGYERWYSTHMDEGGQKMEWVSVHRLCAVAWFGWDAVCDMDIHHINHIPWDNRECNIEVLDKAEHGKLHSDKYWNG